MFANLIKAKYLPLGLASAIAVVIVGLFAWLARWRGLPFSIDPSNILNVMAPLLLTAGFIERSVEVIVSPWRDAEATKLGRALTLLQMPATPPPAPPAGGAAGMPPVAPAGPSGTPEQINAASEKFAEYKGKTQQYAFMTSLTLSLAAASVGVRALWPLLDIKAKSGFEQADPKQRGAFLIVDVVLTAALLAGGADGIHAVINSFTTFFNTTAQKAQQSADKPA
jgi:hypothetical protein